MGKLRLVCKDGRDGFPELLSQIFEILLMGYLDKTFYRLFIQSVQIRFIVKPGIVPGYFKIGKPFLKSLFQRRILIDLFILCKITILQPYLISSKECALIASDRLSGRAKLTVSDLLSVLALRSKKQKTDSVFVSLVTSPPPAPDGQRSSSYSQVHISFSRLFFQEYFTRFRNSSPM